MKRRIAVYGGTDLDQYLARFVRHLGRAIVARPELVLVTGGYLHRTRDARTDSEEIVPAYSSSKSTDFNAVTGALDFLRVNNEVVNERVETWLPEADRDRANVVRFREGFIRIIPGATAQARRFALVNGVDAVVAIKGRRNTAQVLDLALAIDKSALPLPFTGSGSDSANYWRDNTTVIQNWFNLSDAEIDSLGSADIRSMNDDQMTELAEQILGYVWRGIERRCLALMPFDDEAKAFFSDVLETTTRDAGFKIERIDLEPEGGQIYDKFVSHLAGADAILADITGYNRNVMYELGHVHANGGRPFLYRRITRTEDSQESLPFYLKGHAIESVVTSEPAMTEHLQARLRAYLDVNGA